MKRKSAALEGGAARISRRVDFDSDKFVNLEEYKIKVLANTNNKTFVESSLVKIENNTQVKIKVHSHNLSPEDLDIEIKTRVLK